MKNDKIKAVALISTGLDSLLAAKIVQNQGVDVQGVCYYYQFDGLAEKYHSGGIAKSSEKNGIPIRVEDISEDFLPTLLNPSRGYGSGFNPCIDCHMFMFKRAAMWMAEIGASFLITGEVVGQRPMSQNKPTLFHINKTTGLDGLILRPLCAKHMPETIPEEKGWVDREKLYDFNGRTRTPQIALAKEIGIIDYPEPAGGCVLTEPNFSRRAKAFIQHRGKEYVTVESLKLNRYGRHFWLRDDLQVIVGRDESDNQALETFKDNRCTFEAVEIPGPLVIAEGVRDSEDMHQIAAITARYCKHKGEKSIPIAFNCNGEKGVLHVDPADPKEILKWQI